MHARVLEGLRVLLSDEIEEIQVNVRL